MRKGIIRIQRDRLPNPFHCEIITSGLMRDDPDEAPRFRMGWLRRKNLPTQRFGFAQPASLMALNRDLKCLREGHGGRMENEKWQMENEGSSRKSKMDHHFPFSSSQSLRIKISKSFARRGKLADYYE